jgi:hypothetical protein
MFYKTAAASQRYSRLQLAQLVRRIQISTVWRQLTMRGQSICPLTHQTI